MVKKVSGSSKIKMCVVMCLVFAVSFLLTAKAFAAKEFNIPNHNYLGTYSSNKKDGSYVIIYDEYISIFQYHDANEGYISGRDADGALTSRDYGFSFDVVYRFAPNESVNNVPIADATISGKTDVKTGGFLNMFIKEVTLEPDYITSEYYTMKK